jgi:hypothetical protein
MDFTSGLLEHTLVYRLWQAPFARKKFLPIFKYNDLTQARAVFSMWLAAQAPPRDTSANLTTLVST